MERVAGLAHNARHARASMLGRQLPGSCLHLLRRLLCRLRRRHRRRRRRLLQCRRQLSRDSVALLRRRSAGDKDGRRCGSADAATMPAGVCKGGASPAAGLAAGLAAGSLPAAGVAWAVSSSGAPAGVQGRGLRGGGGKRHAAAPRAPPGRWSTQAFMLVAWRRRLSLVGPVAFVGARLLARRRRQRQHDHRSVPEQLAVLVGGAQVHVCPAFGLLRHPVNKRAACG